MQKYAFIKDSLTIAIIQIGGCPDLHFIDNAALFSASEVVCSFCQRSTNTGIEYSLHQRSQTSSYVSFHYVAHLCAIPGDNGWT